MRGREEGKREERGRGEGREREGRGEGREKM